MLFCHVVPVELIVRRVVSFVVFMCLSLCSVDNYYLPHHPSATVLPLRQRVQSQDRPSPRRLLHEQRGVPQSLACPVAEAGAHVLLRRVVVLDFPCVCLYVRVCVCDVVEGGKWCFRVCGVVS